MTSEKIAYSLRDIMTNVADRFGEPAGMMFDMSVLSEIQKEYVGAVESLDSEISELRGMIAKLTARVQELEEPSSGEES